LLLFYFPGCSLFIYLWRKCHARALLINHHQKPMEGKTMRIGVPKERLANETRVAATPKTVEQLLKLGFTVAVESGAGKLASFDDKAFTRLAQVVDGNNVWQSPLS
jgi:NAD(P) transhydrogenase subunit alpha